MKLITVVSMVAMLFSFNCAAVTQLSPSRFFDAEQLELAFLIKNQSFDEIKKKAVFTDLNSPGREGMTLLLYSLLNAAKNKTTIGDQTVSVLVRAGADPLINIPEYGSVAEVMATSDDPRYLKALIDGGLDKNAVSNYRPLIINATSHHSRKVLEYLVGIGADVDQPDSAGKTALMVGLGRYDFDEVNFLLMHGANPNVKNKAGWGFREMLQKKIEKGDNDITMSKLLEIKKIAESKGMRSF